MSVPAEMSSWGVEEVVAHFRALGAGKSECDSLREEKIDGEALEGWFICPATCFGAFVPFLFSLHV